MDDGGDRLVRIVEPGDDALERVGWQLEAVAVDVDVVPAFLVPIRDLRRVVAQRLSQALLHFARAGPLGYRAEDRAQPGASRNRRAEQAAEEEERHCRKRHDQRDAHDCGAVAGERRHDEADREQDHTQTAGEVDGTKDAPQCRRGASPPADEKRKGCQEQDNRGRGPQGRLRRVRSVIVRHEHEVVGAGVRLARVPLREHGVQQRSGESRHITCDHERSCPAAEQLAARIREHEVDERCDEQAAEERAECVRNGVVRLAETADEYAEAHGDHQHPRAVLRPSRPADQAGEDERPADEEPERDRDRGVRLVVTRGDERNGDPTRYERSRPEVEPRPPYEGHAMRRAAIAAPDRSAFGTKPLAPQTWMQRP